MAHKVDLGGEFPTQKTLPSILEADFLFLKLKRSSLAHSNEQKKLRQISYVHVTSNLVLARLELILWLKKWFLGSQDAHSDGFLRFFFILATSPDILKFTYGCNYVWPTKSAKLGFSS